MPFPCTQCGECCRRVDRHDLTRHLDRGDGTCRHFDEVGWGCTIYAARPFFCDIEKAHALLFAQDVSLVEFYRLNAAACNTYQDEAGLPARYRVILPP